MTLPLTENQERLWRYIDTCERSPTFDEMAAAIGYRSKGGLGLMIRALEQKGYLRRTPGRRRAIVATNPNADLSVIPTAALAAELARRLAP